MYLGADGFDDLQSILGSIEKGRWDEVPVRKSERESGSCRDWSPILDRVGGGYLPIDPK